MLTQFNRIKKALISEGRLVKYLLYIVGETLLVAIGILIALQVDNWDKDQDNRKFEHQYYQSMKTELLEDKKALKDQIEYGKRYKIKYTQALDIINSGNRQKVNELGFIVTELKNFSDFRRKSTIYQTLVNSGEIKHVRNHSIIGAFQDLESEYLYIERLEDVHREAAMDNLSSWVISAIQWSPFKVHEPDFLYGHVVNNTFVLIVGLIDEKNQVYQNAIDVIDETLETLEILEKLQTQNTLSKVGDS